MSWATVMGQANEKIARIQDSYVTASTECWLESLERSLAQMKEYQVALLSVCLYETFTDVCRLPEKS
jgi:hypothetical protein